MCVVTGLTIWFDYNYLVSSSMGFHDTSCCIAFSIFYINTHAYFFINKYKQSGKYKLLFLLFKNLFTSAIEMFHPKKTKTDTSAAATSSNCALLKKRKLWPSLH